MTLGRGDTSGDTVDVGIVGDIEDVEGTDWYS